MAAPAAPDKDLKVAFPESGTTKLLVQPGGKIDLGNIDLSKVKIDILGSDLILTDPVTGAKVVLVGIVAFMFDKEDAPIFLLDGNEISPQMILANIGEVGNLSVKDFIAISTILPTDSTAASEATKENSKEDARRPPTPSEIEAKAMQMLKSMGQSDTSDQSQQSASNVASAEQVQKAVSPRAVDEEGEAPPVPKFTSNSTNSGSGSSNNPGLAPPEPADVKSLETQLLQVARTSEVQTIMGVDTVIVRGGGGSDISFFDPNPAAQYSTELISLATETRNIIMNNDETVYFDGTTMSRVIEVVPTIPDGFKIVELSLEGFPSNFTVVGATFANGVYTFLNPPRSDTGTVRIIVTYTVPVDQEFESKIVMKAEFDAALYQQQNPGAPLIVPTTSSFEVTVDQPAIQQNVGSAVDYNKVDSTTGVPVWVFSNQPNENRVFTGSGNDIINGGVGIDTAFGGEGNDTLYGNQGNDTLNGEGGNDTLVGGLGNDTMIGGSGVDFVDYSTLTQNVVVNLGTLVGGYAVASIGTSGQPDYQQDYINTVENITTGSGADRIGGNESNNVIFTQGGNDTIYGSAGADTLDGGTGNDTVDYSPLNGTVNFIEVTLNTTNNVTVQIDGGTNNIIRNIENVVGTSGNDRITGDSLANILSGAGGNDILAGRGGVDTLDGGAGSDTVSYSNAANGVVASLAGNGATDDGDGATDVYISIENLTGSAFVDQLTGDSADNILNGLAGNDTLNAGGGNDTFIDDVGSDVMDGGAGIDTLDYSQLAGATAISVTLNGSTNATVTVTGGQNDTVRNVENVIGTAGNDTILGDTASNHLQGRDGDDYLYGGVGNDTLDGGVGIDTADYSTAASFVDIDMSTGTVANDGDGGQDVILNIENITGSAFADRIIGNSSANTLTGGTGNDTLSGRGGADTLDGGANNDTVDYSGAVAGVIASLAANGASDDGDGSTDTYVSIENITGSAFADTLTGDNAANTLSGAGGNDTISDGGGNDTVLGGAGNDLFLAGAGSDDYDGGADVDTLDYTGLAGTTGISVVLNGGTVASVTVSGGQDDTVRNIENVTGTTANDTIYGDANNNILRGGDGDDVIRGGLGSDILQGGNGTDTVRFDDLTGSIILNIGAGLASFSGDSSTDTFSGFEVFYTTNFNDEVSGTAIAETIFTLNGDDTIFASGGADTVDGGGGTDIIDYSLLSGVTALDVTLAGNTDALVTITGGTNQILRNVENVIGSTGADTITGDSGVNYLQGNVGNDILSGMNGDDTLDGGQGNDTLIGGAGNDILTGGLGADTFKWSLGDQSTTGTPAADHITDFTLGAGGDVLDLKDLLVGDDSNNITQFLHFDEATAGGDVVIKIDHNGSTDGVGVTQTITLEGVTLAELLALPGANVPSQDQSIINKLIANGNLEI